MPVTLAQASLNAATAIDRTVIDEYRRNSVILDALPFDQAVNASGAGATLTYGYTRILTPSGAAYRAINSEYTPTEATKEQKFATLKVLGGSFQIDRVLDAVAAGAETAFQMEQKIAAAANLFADRVINGDSATESAGWDGLSKALTGSSTETTVGTGNTVDLSAVNTQALAFSAMAKIDAMLALLNGRPSMLLANRQAIAALKGTARFATALDSRDVFGGTVDTYDGIPLVDPGDYVNAAGTSSMIIPTVAGGLTDIYAVRFGLDGFHGVSLAGQPLVRQWLPDFTKAGAVKTGEVEMVCAPVLKAQRAAAVLRKVKVA